jgi:hypothetical protein
MLEFAGFHAVLCRTLLAQMFELAGIPAAMPGGSAIDVFPMSLLIAPADSIGLVNETAAYRSVFIVLARDLARSNGCQAHHHPDTSSSPSERFRYWSVT